MKKERVINEIDALIDEYRNMSLEKKYENYSSEFVSILEALSIAKNRINALYDEEAE